MATGALVPFEIKPGVTVMMPDYLVEQQRRASGGLALPSVPRPTGDPNRLAEAPGGPKTTATDATQWGPADAPPDMSVFQPTPGQLRQQLMGSQQSQAPEPKSHGSAPSKFDQLDKLGKEPAGGKGKVDPSSLATGGGKRQAQEGGESDAGMGPMVQVYNETLRRGRGGGGGLTVGSMKVEREPGKELIPELQWQYGLAERPDLGEELDPNAAQPTIGTADPVTRKVMTPLERAAQGAGDRARISFDREEETRQELGIVQRQALLQQSELIDSQLTTIAERRNRIAQLQEVADKRMREAETNEPRTKGEIWESKGGLAHVMGFLAMAIGGYTQGLGRNGGKNPGWEMINKALDDEVEGERDRAERRYKVGQNARNDVERAHVLYGDLDAAMVESKNRKLASVMAMAQQQMADRTLDLTAKERAAKIYEAAKEQVYAGAQQLNDMLVGKVTKEEINYKPGVTGGGGAAPTTLEALEKAARAKKAVDTITGADDRPKASPAEAAELNAQEAGLAPLKSMLQRYRGADSIPGAGSFNVASRGARGVLDFIGGQGSGSKALDSDEERANAMIVNRARLAYKHAVTGAGGSDTEASIIDQAFAGASTKADLENAVRISEETIAERRRLSAGGESKAQPGAAAAPSFRPE